LGFSIAADSKEQGLRVSEFDAITPEQWQRLASRRIFFGHQSVGGNLLEGVQEVLEECTAIPLRVVDFSEAGELLTPGLYHRALGRNGEPSSKLAAFCEIVNRHLGDNGVVLLKYCYVDVTLGTSPEALFEEYRSGVESLRKRHPGLTIVHVTLPLTSDHGTLRYVAAIARGLPTVRGLNLSRHRYNELLRQTYGGKDPIFDLAHLESTRPDGRTAIVRHQGKRIPVLASDWTYDGGHLNQAGRKHMAKVFLATLASAQDGGASAP
jgi:hypothetical protein